MKLIQLLTLVCFFVINPSQANDSRLADLAYNNSQFDKAYTLYSKLAKTGDKFSQHRLAEMMTNGQGTSKDSITAFAWAYVASEDNHLGIVKFRNKIFESLSKNDKLEAITLAEKTYHQYGNLAQIIKAKAQLEKKLQNCTGTRIKNKNSCARVISAKDNNHLYYQKIKALIEKYDEYIKENNNKPMPRVPNI